MSTGRYTIRTYTEIACNRSEMEKDFCNMNYIINMSLVLRKPVFAVSDQVRHKLYCTATKDGQRLEISDIGSGGIVLSVYQLLHSLSASLFSQLQKKNSYLITRLISTLILCTVSYLLTALNPCFSVSYLQCWEIKFVCAIFHIARKGVNRILHVW